MALQNLHLRFKSGRRLQSSQQRSPPRRCALVVHKAYDAQRCAPWPCQQLPVSATNRRLTALLLVPRLARPAGSGSRLRACCRVAAPTSIYSTTRRFSGSVSASVRSVGNGISCPPARTRERCTGTWRPPSAISLDAVPAREATRSAWCAYRRGPLRAVRSSAIIAVSTFRAERMANSKSSGGCSNGSLSHDRRSR
jgi:hypothetical protein